jgi:hypothetical protein
MQSTETAPGLTDEQRQTLLEVALRSIEHGIKHGQPLRIRLVDHAPRLREPGASFVTLRKKGELRGCIGTLEARQPLIQDVATHAFDAAFNDPRFAPLAPAELPAVDLHLSVLSTPVAIDIDSEDELLARLQPGRDGLVLEEGRHRATFLPAVWDQLPEPQNFLSQLKLKAGLAPDHWSKNIRFYRYATESFPE